MTWNEHHLASENHAIQAELAAKNRDHEAAIRLYRQAAEEEALAIPEVEPGKTRTLAVTLTSAASLWFKAEEFRRAEQLACQWLATEGLPAFASDQLQAVLQSVWNERTLRESGIKFSSGEVLVRVAGGEIVHGGAPLDLISLKVDEVRNLFYRTIELLLSRPLRRRGTPSSDIQERFRPWLLQAPAGSYQFAVRVQKPLQLPLYPAQEPEVEEVCRKVLEIIDGASQERPDLLVQRVPNAEYREVFLKLARNLAPTGRTFNTLEMRSTSDIDARPIDRRFASYATGLEKTDESGIYNHEMITEPNNAEEKTCLVDYIRQARSFAESTLDSFSHDHLNELAYLGEPISHLYPSLDEETAVTKLWELCNRHGLEVNNALKRIQGQYDDPYQERPKDSLLAILAEQSYLKDPVLRLIEAICDRLSKAIPTLFQHNPPANEPDLNDKIQSIIETNRDDYAREHPGIRFALATTIPDHSFKSQNLVVETKYIRGQTTPSKASEGIAADITKYGSDGYTMLFIVYDPDRAIKDDGQFSSDFEKTGKCTVRIFR